ncbi:MAG: peptidoglycan DD-metalloendopeptidase family protein [Spirochaetaceae bacterium]
MDSVINRQSLTRRSSFQGRSSARMNAWENPQRFLMRASETGTARPGISAAVNNRRSEAGLLRRLEQTRRQRSALSLLKRARALDSGNGETGPQIGGIARFSAVAAIVPAIIAPVHGLLTGMVRMLLGVSTEMIRLPQQVIATESGEVAPVDQGFIAGGILFVVVGLGIVSTPTMQDLMRYNPFPEAIALDHTHLLDPLSQNASVDEARHLDGSEVELDISRFQALTFQQHTVAPGETISGIASRYGITMDTLVSFNQINDSRRVQVGTEFQIPSRSGLRHIVRSGESLAGIAGSYGVEVAAVLDANDLSTDTVTVGQELFIPEARMRSTELRLILGELFILPTAGRLTSGFGYRPDPFTGRRSFHNGVDWAAPRGTAITASMAGRVVESGVHSIYGNYVVIQHPEGFQSLYAHLDRILVNRGQTVDQRQRIATMGSTGRSTGNHLHFSLFRNGQAVDPLRHVHR